LWQGCKGLLGDDRFTQGYSSPLAGCRLPSAWSNLDSKGLPEDAEDVYFAIGCVKLGLKIGDDEDSAHFSLHSIYKDEFFGIHQPRKEFGERLNNKFPELKYKNPYLNLVDYKDLNNKGIKRTFVDNFINMSEYIENPMNSMNVLVYGAKGWIGQQFIQVLKANNTKFVAGVSRADNYETLLTEITDVSPTHVVSFIGRTHGKIGEKVYPTIDYLEQEGIQVVYLNLTKNILLARRRMGFMRIRNPTFSARHILLSRDSQTN